MKIGRPTIQRAISEAIRNSFILITAIIITFPSSGHSEFSLDLLSLAAGSWIATPTDVSKATEYYNKLSAISYVSFKGFKGFLAAPLTYSIKDHPNPEKDTDQIWTGNVRLYMGRRIGLLEPRIGAIIPTGYSTDFEKNAWIGTGNFELYLGVGLNSNLREESKFGVSGELMAHFPVWGEEAVEAVGSWTLEPSAKASYEALERLRIGGEVLVFFSKSYYRWNREGKNGTYEPNDYELGLVLVPHVYGELTLTETLRMTAKIGYGPNYKNPHNGTWFRHSGNTANVGVAAQFYL